MALAENVKRLRAAAGLTQMQLATAAALNVSIVSQIEQGTNADPRGSTLSALARALGVGVDDLLQPASGPAEEAKPPAKGRRSGKGK